jgi:exocyst complex component 8
MRSRTSVDLQQNVYQNRTQFIKISKEAEKLKGEMRTLRGLMSELKANTNALKQATAELSPSAQLSPFDSVNVAIRKQANRSSVADLTAMWTTQLQALWKNVEGSQKFLPAVPGRRVVRDSPHWVELNAATWKSRRAMHMFLLNDHLLVASRKKKRMNSSAGATSSSQKQQPVPSKLVAERCWPLTDIEMVDLSSGLSPVGAAGAKREREYVVNAINIRVGQESFTYRNDKMDEKVSLLLTFRKAADELRKVLRAEAEDGGRIRDSINYFAARDPALFKQPYLMETLTESMSKDRPHVLVEVDGKQQNFRWVENQIDELDIQIALQGFEDAISRVEKMRKVAKSMKGNLVAQDLLNLKIDERAGKLARLITRQLVDAHSLLNATMRNVSWLTRLGFEDRAREAYLEARSGVIGKRTR